MAINKTGKANSNTMKNLSLTLALLLLTGITNAQTAPVNTLDALAAHCDQTANPAQCKARLAKLKQTNPSVGTNVYPGNAVQTNIQADMATYCNSSNGTYNAARCTSAMQSYRNFKPAK